MDEHLLRFDTDKTLVFIDCETENLCLNFMHNLPWQIAMIKTKGGKKIDEKNYHVKWDRELNVSADAARLTGFNKKKYERLALSYDEIFATVRDWLDNADYILGHNILGFDVYLIKEYYRKMKVSDKHLLQKYIDTNALAKAIKLGTPYKEDDSLIEYQYRAYNKKKRGVRTHLKVLIKEYNISCDESKLHDALYDLEVNLQVWNKLKHQVEI